MTEGEEQGEEIAVCDWSGLCPNVGVNDDRLGSSVVMLGDGSDGFVAGDCGGVGGS